MAKRKTHSAAFKAQVALAAVRGDRTMNQVAAQFGVHPTLIHGWRKKLVAGAAGIFESGGPAVPGGPDPAELFEQIGRLKMELEWLKKKAAAVV
jgi:putative transposase